MHASQKTTRSKRTARGARGSATRRPAARAPDAAGVAGAALASARVAAPDRLDLLDLRAESHIALGDVESAGADAEAMLHIARRAKKPARFSPGCTPNSPAM